MNIFNNLSNPRHTIYKLASACKVMIPPKVAAILSFSNRYDEFLKMDTYDGSGQAVHPSVVEYNGKLYMAVTPYPYGVEWYENPSIYVYYDEVWKAIPGLSPVIKPNKLGCEHYSDPCLYTGEAEISLLFRKCERRENGKRDLLFVMHSKDGYKWDAPRLLADRAGDTLISPAVVGNQIWCVEAVNKQTSLVVYKFDNNCIELPTPVPVILSEKWRIWHIDVQQTLEGKVQGLFMLVKTDSRQYESKLALFRLLDGVWCYQHDIKIPDTIRLKIKYIYKSAFHPNGEDIICSACDLKGRFFLFQMKP
ncbi:hypothetical protein ACTQ4E_12790 [Lawsonibacter sp. LCP25S3_G6]|uniref:hypothetical protein n=1 Tax=unclassified Lawsonibacter TaxID=2617946 RepID=UPI003F9B8AC2